MKGFLKTTTAIGLGIALTLGFQYLPLQETPAKAQTSGRIVAGPLVDVWDNSFLTPVSSTPRTVMPPYALPRMNFWDQLGNSNSVMPRQTDLNGDGLMDYYYSQVSAIGGSGDPYAYQYVLLNNGVNFELAYICRYNYNSYYNTHTYKGDCANQ